MPALKHLMERRESTDRARNPSVSEVACGDSLALWKGSATVYANRQHQSPHSAFPKQRAPIGQYYRKGRGANLLVPRPELHEVY
jgi:hypothetical protein